MLTPKPLSQRACLGFSIVEVLIAVLILASVVGALTEHLRILLRSYSTLSPAQTDHLPVSTIRQMLEAELRSSATLGDRQISIPDGALGDKTRSFHCHQITSGLPLYTYFSCRADSAINRPFEQTQPDELLVWSTENESD
ncbi:MAG: hypothetical protein U0136_11750 [Bdellovibrionota bacterium]